MLIHPGSSGDTRASCSRCGPQRECILRTLLFCNSSSNIKHDLLELISGKNKLWVREVRRYYAVREFFREDPKSLVGITVTPYDFSQTDVNAMKKKEKKYRLERRDQARLGQKADLAGHKGGKRPTRAA